MSTEPLQIIEPTRIDFKTGRFTANGHDYYITEYIPVGREIQYKRASNQLAHGLDWKGVFKLLNDIFVAATSDNTPISNLHTVATLATNGMDGTKGIAQEERIDSMYVLCALIINRVGEAPATISERQIKEKYEDWCKEGIPREDFLELAVASLQHSENVLKVLQKSIEEAEKTSPTTDTTGQ